MNVRDYFRTVWVEYSGLFSDSHDRIFETIFKQSRTVLRFGFDPGTDDFGFCCAFWYHNNLLMNGTKKKGTIMLKGFMGLIFNITPMKASNLSPKPMISSKLTSRT